MCEAQATAAEQQEELELDTSAARPEAADQAQIEALIASHLTGGLELFPEDVMSAALHDFVEKVRGSGLYVEKVRGSGLNVEKVRGSGLYVGSQGAHAPVDQVPGPRGRAPGTSCQPHKPCRERVLPCLVLDT